MYKSLKRNLIISNMSADIVFWSGAGFISSYLISNIVFYYVDSRVEAPIFSPFTFIGLICGFVRGYTGKSVVEVLMTK